MPGNTIQEEKKPQEHIINIREEVNFKSKIINDRSLLKYALIPLFDFQSLVNFMRVNHEISKIMTEEILKMPDGSGNRFLQSLDKLSFSFRERVKIENCIRAVDREQMHIPTEKPLYYYLKKFISSGIFILAAFGGLLYSGALGIMKINKYNHLIDESSTSLVNTCPYFFIYLKQPDGYSDILPYNATDSECNEQSYGWQDCVPFNNTLSEFCNQCISLCNNLSHLNSKLNVGNAQSVLSIMTAIFMVCTFGCFICCCYSEKNSAASAPRFSKKLSIDTQNLLTQLNIKIKSSTTCKQTLKSLHEADNKLVAIEKFYYKRAQTLFTLFKSPISNKNSNVEEVMGEKRIVLSYST